MPIGGSSGTDFNASGFIPKWISNNADGRQGNKREARFMEPVVGILSGRLPGGGESSVHTCTASTLDGFFHGPPTEISILVGLSLGRTLAVKNRILQCVEAIETSAITEDGFSSCLLSFCTLESDGFFNVDR